MPCRSPRGLPGPRAPTCVSCIARQVLYQLSHLLVFIKRGLVAHSKPVCGIGGEGRGHHRQPVQVSSETFYLKHQQAPRVKVSALPASPWPPPPFRRQPNVQAVTWAFSSTCLKVTPPKPAPAELTELTETFHSVVDPSAPQGRRKLTGLGERMLREGLRASMWPFQAALGPETRKLPASLVFPALRRLFCPAVISAVINQWGWMWPLPLPRGPRGGVASPKSPATWAVALATNPHPPGDVG